MLPANSVHAALVLRIRPRAGEPPRLLQVPLLAELDSYSSTSRTAPGDRAPDFSFVDATGKATRLADLRGKVVLVNLFATWCGPCKAELPHLEKEVAARFPAEAFALICVGVGHGPDELDAFQKEQDLHLLMVPDPDKAIHHSFVERTGIPRNYVIDRKGTIIYVSSGYDEREFSRLVKVIERTIDASASGNL